MVQLEKTVIKRGQHTRRKEKEMVKRMKSRIDGIEKL